MDLSAINSRLGAATVSKLLCIPTERVYIREVGGGGGGWAAKLLLLQ